MTGPTGAQYHLIITEPAPPVLHLGAAAPGYRRILVRILECNNPSEGSDSDFRANVRVWIGGRS